MQAARVIALAVLSLFLPQLTATAQYLPIELAPLPGYEQSRAFGINANGEIAGHSVAPTPNDFWTATVWDRDGNPSALPTPIGCLQSWASTINASGVIAGRADSCAFDSPGPRAVVWDRHGDPTLLPLLLGRYSAAFDVNAGDLIVGGEVDVSFIKEFAVFWDRDGNPTELPHLDPNQVSSGTRGINAAGEIVGFSALEGPDPWHLDSPVVWDRHGNPTSLPLPSSALFGAKALSISERGEVVGLFSPLFLVGVHGVVWDRDRNFRELRPLPGYVRTFLRAGKIINVRGVVVGTSSGLVEFERATVWDSDGNPTALPFLGPNDYRSWASAINAAGEIVGFVESSSDGFRAVVWRPDRRGAP